MTNKMNLPDLNQKKYTERLSCLFSARIRLDDNQRDQLKKAWVKLRDSQTPSASAPIPGSTIRAQTTYQCGNLNGVSALTFNEIITSRETIALTTVLSLQAQLGLELISRSFLEEKFGSYLDYIFTTAEANA
jgi:hypothetical protein